MKKIYDDGELRLRVVIPIAFDQSSPSPPDCSLKFSECACCEDNNNNHHHHYNSVDSEALEDSDCTEDEKVALEQLVELRRICRLSSEEDPDDYSAVTTPCATEGSFNTCKGSPQPEPLLSPSPTSEGLPTVSSSFIFNFGKLKDIQKQPSPQQDHEQDNIHVNIVDIIATTSGDSKALHHHDCSLDSLDSTCKGSPQLVELRRICRLSSEVDPDDYSAVTTPCATEGSFNTCKGSPQPEPLPSPSPTSEGLPTASSSIFFNFWKLKDIQKQPPPQQDHEQDNIHVNIVDMIATTSGDFQALHHHDCSLDSSDSQFDERLNPRTRLLSDIYHDKMFSSFSLPNKKVKWRRKALNKIMEMGI